MDILDILLDILLKPPEPLMGLFFSLSVVIFDSLFSFWCPLLLPSLVFLICLCLSSYQKFCLIFSASQFLQHAHTGFWLLLLFLQNLIVAEIFMCFQSTFLKEFSTTLWTRKSHVIIFHMFW